MRDYDTGELLNEVRRYAIIKRREVKNPNAMEVDAVHKGKRERSNESFARYKQNEKRTLQNALRNGKRP